MTDETFQIIANKVILLTEDDAELQRMSIILVRSLNQCPADIIELLESDHTDSITIDQIGVLRFWDKENQLLGQYTEPHDA